MTFRASVLFLATLLITALGNFLPAQTPDPLGWNAPRPLEMMARARVRRELPRGDSTLKNYVARANGYVYFYLDRQESDERTLVKVDQIAIDMYWKNPDRTKQRIIGLRDVSRLPNRMYYHLDHLTVVQNNLGDVIKIGDGDEVRDVPHPAAQGADTVYDFRLADSVTLQLGGEQGTVRVYEIQVRPKRTNRSALVGSVFVDRETADIVRMTFTFTPASYVDRRLDYINISLDNGLFAGRYWLPAEQSVEIRRQLPELDFAAGAIIKGRIRISNYAFNQPLSDTLFWGREVTAVPEAQRRAFPFERDIYAGVNEEGLAPTPRMEELQSLAAELVGESKLSGLPPVRLYMPDASSFVRYNRAEGWYGGLGASYIRSPSLRFDALGGYAFGADHVAGLVQARGDRAPVRWSVTGEANTMRDIGPVEGMEGVLNTMAGRLRYEDYLDPYYADALSARVEYSLSPLTRVHGRVAAEAHSSAELTQDANDFRPLIPIDDGRFYIATLGLQRAIGETSGRRTGVELDVDVVRSDAREFIRPRVAVRTQYDSEDKRTYWAFGVRGSTALGGDGELPRQYQSLIGGRETIPGYRYRAFGGEHYGLATFEYSRAVWEPWLRLRVIGGAGATGFSETLQDSARFPVSDGIKAGGGVGAGLFWDVLRVDFTYGDKFRTILSVTPNLRDLL
jgi:hypothetical protein